MVKKAILGTATIIVVVLFAMSLTINVLTVINQPKAIKQTIHEVKQPTVYKYRVNVYSHGVCNGAIYCNSLFWNQSIRYSMSKRLYRVKIGDKIMFVHPTNVVVNILR